ncbi:MAG: hypothetical protein ACOYI8_01180 [Christensenellales bacterium]|jgi:hypothetical protein
MSILREIVLFLLLAATTASPLCPSTCLGGRVLSGFLQGATKATEPIEVRCPQCGSENVIEIVYGYPTEEALERAEAGELRLGGCVIGYCDPNRYCKNCEHEWFQQ